MALSALAKPLFRLPQPTFAACFQCGFRFNTYLVLAIAARLGGAEAVALASLAVGLMVPVVNVAAVAMLARGHAGRIALEIARNPLVLATLAGIAWNAAGWTVPQVPRTRMLELARERRAAARSARGRRSAALRAAARCRCRRSRGSTPSSSARCRRSRSRWRTRSG